MKSRTLTCITAITFFAALAIPVQLAAQESSNRRNAAYRGLISVAILTGDADLLEGTAIHSTFVFQVN